MMMQHAAATNTINKTSILALFRRCIRSAQKIPDPNRRAAYLIHVREGFHKHAHIPSNSREELLAYRDGMEQVEQMEYYHSQMKMKQNGKNQNINTVTSSQIIPGASKNETNNMVIEHWLSLHLPHLN